MLVVRRLKISSSNEAARDIFRYLSSICDTFGVGRSLFYEFGRRLRVKRVLFSAH